MSDRPRRALVLAQPEDVENFRQKLLVRGYEVDVIASASEEFNLSDYEIVCIGGNICSAGDAAEAIETIASQQRERAPRRRLRAN